MIRSDVPSFFQTCFPGSNISRKKSALSASHIVTCIWALATFSVKALDVGGKDASLGLNHVTCNFDNQSFLKSLWHGPVDIGV